MHVISFLIKFKAELSRTELPSLGRYNTQAKSNPCTKHKQSRVVMHMTSWQIIDELDSIKSMS